MVKTLKTLFAIFSLFGLVFALYRLFNKFKPQIKTGWEKLSPLLAEVVEDELNKKLKEVGIESKLKPVFTSKNLKAVKQTIKRSLPKEGVFELNPRQKQVYETIKREVEVGMQTIMAALGPAVTDRTLRRDMTKLERLGLITQVGKTKGAVYKLKE